MKKLIKRFLSLIMSMCILVCSPVMLGSAFADYEDDYEDEYEYDYEYDESECVHDWVEDDATYKDNTSHIMHYTCWLCGAEKDEVASHNIDEYGDEYTKVDSKYHSVEAWCDDCYSEIEVLKEHKYKLSSSYKKVDDKHHVQLYKCSKCGATKKSDVVESHEWDDWEVTKKATIFKKGEKTRQCLECGAKQTKATAKAKPFAKFKKKQYALTAGKVLSLKAKLKMASGDKVKQWKSSNNYIATVTKAGKIKAKQKGTVKITAILKSGKKTTCTVKVKAKPVPKKKTSSNSSKSSGSTVYWVPNGSVYHVSRYCSTLSRSKTVYSGTIQQSGKSRCCKVCG